MADLGGGAPGGLPMRAANGGGRSTQGPVPVSSAPPAPSASSARATVIPPTEIMRRRQQRERNAAAEANAEEQRRQQEQPGRAPVSTAGVAGQPLSSQTFPQQSASGGHRRTQSTAGPTRATTDPPYNPAQQTHLARHSQSEGAAGPVGGPVRSAAQGQGQGQSTQPQYDTGAPQTRQRATTQSSGQPRPVPPTAGPSGTQRPPQQAQAQSSAQRQSGTVPPPQQRQDARWPGPSDARSEAPPEAPRRPGASAGHPGFPHAFERWELLSSRWEGVTSSWIRKMEVHDEATQNDPIISQLSRQVTDLSAAGANLFHAVVELQRLRASSERKFQRWFIDTRKELERHAEISAELEKAMVGERELRANDAAKWEARVEQTQRQEANAQKLVTEMRRELQISKDEARRAWEELGRREQEERDRVTALNQGQAIVVGGYTVHPKQFQDSRQGSVARPGTRDGPSQLQEEYQYEPATSPSNTDPFTEAQPGHGLHHEPATLASAPPSAWPSYAPTTQSGASSSSKNTSILFPTSSVLTSTAPRPSAMASNYQGAVEAGPATQTFYNQPNAHLQPSARPGPAKREEQPISFFGGSDDYEPSEQDEEGYEMDEHGKVIRDAHGNPIPWRRGLHPVRSEESDEFNVDEDRRREQELADQYRASSTAVSYPAVPAPSSSRVPQQQSSMRTSQPPAPSTSHDIMTSSGGMVLPPEDPRAFREWEMHHHPTRLSDVMEQDEEELRSRVSELSQGANLAGTSGAPF